MKTKHTGTSRRTFIKRAAALSAVPMFHIIPAHAAPRSKGSKKNSAVAPSEKLNLAIIGCSHMGGTDGKAAMSTGLVNCVALCDVVESRTGYFKSKHKDAEVFSDFRDMFDKMGDKIDACTIGVPDHAHFPISMQAQ